MKTAWDLFLYELAVMGAAERSGSLLLSVLIAKRVHNSHLEECLHSVEDDSHRHSAALKECVRAIGSSTLETRVAAVEGIQSGFEDFLRSGPVPAALDLFALDTARRFTHLAAANYEGLVTWAIALDQQRCAQLLHANLVDKREAIGRLDRLSHTMVSEFAAQQPSPSA